MLAFSPTETQAAQASFDTPPDRVEPAPLPAFVAIPLIATMSAGLWVLLWKAGQQVVLLLS